MPEDNAVVIDMPYGGGCPDEIANMDILRIVRKLDRWAQEVGCSDSANINGGLNIHDAKRSTDYLSDFRAYLDFIGAQPVPDVPKTAGRVRDKVPEPFPEMPAITNIENGDIRHIIRQMRSYRIEVTRSQSAQSVMGLHEFDTIRFAAGTTRIENALQYAITHEPSDFPETTPSEPPVPSGK